MVQLFAIFFQALHGTEIVPLAVVSADNGFFLRNIDSTDRITVGDFSRIPVFHRLAGHFFRRCQGLDNPVADIQQQSPYQKSYQPAILLRPERGGFLPLEFYNLFIALQ